MGATVRCAGCGHTAPADARLCLLCGRPIAAPMVELERLDVPATPGQRERVVVEHRGAPQGPKRPLVVGGALVVAAIAAVVFLFAGGGDDGSDGQGDASPSTVDDAGPSSTSPGRPWRPPTSSEVPGITVVSGLDGPEPVLGHETGGLSLYVLSGRSLARVELDTGRITVMERAFVGSPGYVANLRVVDDAVVAWRDSGRYALPTDLSAPPESTSEAQRGPLDLVYGVDGDEGAMTVRHVDDQPSEAWHVPAGASVMTVVDDQLLVQRAGRLYLLQRGGGVREYAIGDFMGSRGGWVLWRGCDEQMRCRLNIGTAQQPVVHSHERDDWEMWANGFGVGLAPDGASVVATRPGQVRPALVRLEDGVSLVDVDLETQIDWTPDGEWAFVRLPGDRVVGVSTRDGRQVPINLPFRFDAQQVALAVG